MKGVLKTLLLFMFVAQAASASENDKKKDFIDISVNGIRLLDSHSYIEKVGGKIKFYTADKVIYTQHYNKTGYEMLTIISNPEDKFSAVKLQVAMLDRKFLMKRNIMKDVAKFITGKGIYLGMRPSEVMSILGKPNNKKNNDDGITMFHYELSSTATESVSKGKKYSSFSSTYSFYKDKLIEFNLEI